MTTVHYMPVATQAYAGSTTSYVLPPGIMLLQKSNANKSPLILSIYFICLYCEVLTSWSKYTCVFRLRLYYFYHILIIRSLEHYEVLTPWSKYICVFRLRLYYLFIF